MNNELKPCPFCGRVDKLKIWKTEQRVANVVMIENWRVVCNREGDETGCGGSGGVRRTQQEAIKAWNRRETMAGDQLMVQSIMRPEDETMAEILLYLNMWQEAHPDLMVALVPAEDRYQYEVIKSGRSADHRDSGA